MEEGSGRGGGIESSRVTPSYVHKGDRQIFTVELRPGETTFVSWKKLMKDANKSNHTPGSTAPANPDLPTPLPHPNLEARLAPGQVELKENDDEGPAQPNRFCAVIEKIERLYMGKDSSDEEELKEASDDDQYDTEDSFIDDAELDEYFEVDNSAVKHNGFFVNRGKLERTNEAPVVPTQQPKKRRRKDMTKAPGENDDSRVSNKQAKLVKTVAQNLAPSLGKSFSAPFQNIPMSSDHNEDVEFQTPSNPSETSSRNRSAEVKVNLDLGSFVKVPNGDASASPTEARDVEKQKTGSLQAKNLASKSKDTGGSSDASLQKYHDKSTFTHSRLQSAKPGNSADEREPYGHSKEKNGIRELPDLNFPDGKITVQPAKSSHIHKKDGSSARPKGSVLEKSIRELEKMVAESRPPASENQDADSSLQAIKRRLPREVKLKLTKVARLAQATQGKISKELLNRLMSSLGHLIQLRTLKRNLKIMINVDVSANEEKIDRFEQTKKEVVEMIKARAPSLESKAIMQQAGVSDDFQEVGPDGKGTQKKKFSMDAVLEDKICDLYDLFVEGLDEDAGPQVRKLYVELASMWPSGFMDNHGIKRAICRAKERRRAIYSRNKEEEKIKRKKMLTPNLEDSVRVEVASGAQPQHMRERSFGDARDGGGPVLALASKTGPISASTAAAGPRVSSPSKMSSPVMDRLKQEKPKGSSCNSLEDGKVGADGCLMKKKAKRRAEQETGDDGFHSEKLQLQSSDERQKPPKQGKKINIQLNTPAPPPPNTE